MIVWPSSARDDHDVLVLDVAVDHLARVGKVEGLSHGFRMAVDLLGVKLRPWRVLVERHPSTWA